MTTASPDGKPNPHWDARAWAARVLADERNARAACGLPPLPPPAPIDRKRMPSPAEVLEVKFRQALRGLVLEYADDVIEVLAPALIARLTPALVAIVQEVLAREGGRRVG